MAAQARMSGSAIEWSPPSTIGIAPAARTAPTVSSIARCDRTGSAGRIGASPKSITRRSPRRPSTPASRWRPAAQLAPRIARGPKRVPGASDVSSSIGAPTITASAPMSSPGSSVYGKPPNVIRPA
jgi:hypothetical protein